MMRDILTSLLVNAAVFSLLFAMLLGARKVMGKNISAVMQYALWALVVIKLLIPFGFESSLSPLSIFDSPENTAADNVQTVNADTYLQNTDSGVLLAEEPGGLQGTETEQAPQINSADAGGYAAQRPANTDGNVRTEINWTVLIFMLWVLGALVAAALAVLDAVKLKRKVLSGRQRVSLRIARIFCECSKELKLRKNVDLIVQSNNSVPFAINVFHPKVVLPSDIEAQSEEQIRFILMHELTHIRYGDMLIIALLNILSAVYWFNPFVWVCFRLIRKDMETACDCRVLSKLERHSRREYIGTVLQFANRNEGRRQCAAIGMADGRMTMEQRIRGMFKTTKTGIKGRIVAACVAVFILAVSVLTACQPTPESEIVVGRQEDVLEAVQTVEPDDFEPVAVPEHISEVHDDYPYLSITYDADVIVPEATAYPVTEVSKKLFTEEEVLSYIDLFIEGDYEMFAGWTLTKDDYLGLLTKAKQYEGTERVTKEIIERLNELYGKATNDVVNPQISSLSELPDGMSLNIKNEDGVISRFGFEQGVNAFWYIRNESTAADTVSSGYAENMDGDIEHYNWMMSGDPSISQEEAYAIALRYKEALGIDLDIHSVEKCSFITDYVDKTIGWKFVFTRSISGLQMIQDVSNSFLMDWAMPSYAAPWGEEALTITVDENGLFSLNWGGASEINKTAVTSVQLVAFDTIHKRITNQLNYLCGTWGEERNAVFEIKITKIELGISLLSVKDETEIGEYLPTWYVTYCYKFSDEDEDQWNWQQIMFSALDGSYVEPRITNESLMGNMDVGTSGSESSVSDIEGTDSSGTYSE